MESPSEKTFLALNAAMRPDYREAVAKEVLEQYKQTAPTTRQRLERALQDHVKIKGFRDPLRAPMGSLLRAVVVRSYRSATVLGALLPVWGELHADLWRALRDFLSARGITIPRAIALEESFAGSGSLPPEIFETANIFQTQYPNFHADDVVLMLCHLAGCVPLSGDSKESLREDGQTMKWQQWLEELRALPADADEWDTILEFVEAVTQLSEEKHHEREASRNILRLALAAMVAHTRQELDYFSLRDVTSWSAAACPLTEVPVLTQQVEQLHECLVKYRSLLQLPATTLMEERQRRAERATLEETILHAHTHLAPVFMVTRESVSPIWEEIEEDIFEEEEPAVEELSTTEPSMPSAAPASLSDGITEAEITAPLAESIIPRPAEVSAASPDTPHVPPEAGRDTAQGESGITPKPMPTMPILLRSSREVAISLQTEDSDELWHAFVWAYIAEDDVPAAYWLVQSLLTSGRTSPVPAWLLAAIQGARWLSPDSEMFVDDLCAIAMNHQPTADDPHLLLGLAAALRPALIAPSSGLAGWLQVPSCCPPLHDIVASVDTFAHVGVALRPEELNGVAGAEQREVALLNAASATKRWLDEASNRRTKIPRASDVWRHLVGPRGDLHTLLLLVSEDHRRDVERVSQALRQWHQRDYLTSHIHQIDRQLVGRKGRPIVGEPLQQLMRWVEEGCHLAKSWCDLVEREHTIATRGNWLLDQMASLRTQVHAAFPTFNLV